MIVKKNDQIIIRNSKISNVYAINSLMAKGDGFVEKRYSPNITNSNGNKIIKANKWGKKE